MGIFFFYKILEKLDVIIYWENIEDIYLGIEWCEGIDIVSKLIDILNKDLIFVIFEYGKK